jgi:hypothetical protein
MSMCLIGMHIVGVDLMSVSIGVDLSVDLLQGNCG